MWKKNFFRYSFRHVWLELTTFLITEKHRLFWFWGYFGRGVKIGRNFYARYPERIKIGKNVVIGDNVEIDNGKYSNLEIGEGSQICSFSSLGLGENANLTIGKKSKINKFNFINCNKEIIIGNEVITAVFCQILDSNHGFQQGQLIQEQPKEYKTTRIGNDVWLGSKVTVLAGSFIGDGVIVGANSVVRGELLSDTVYAGVPVREIKKRL